MIRIKKYKTRLKHADIDNWILVKQNEKKDFKTHFNGYKAESDKYGFRIRERNIKASDSNARVVAKYVDSTNDTVIYMRIIPHIAKTVYHFIAFVFITGFTILSVVLDTKEKFWNDIKLIGIMYLIFFPVFYLFIILPVHDLRKWIERELKLEKIKKSNLNGLK